jgi:hypothetical protein
MKYVNLNEYQYIIDWEKPKNELRQCNKFDYPTALKFDSQARCLIKPDYKKGGIPVSLYYLMIRYNLWKVDFKT